MTTGTKIIKRALRRIGAHSIVSPAAPESINDGMDEMNSMLHIWLSKDIDLGFIPLQVPGDDVAEPADTTTAIVDNLALALSPDYDNGKNIVSPNLQRNADRGYTRVKNLYQKLSIPCKGVSSTLPVGEGNRRRFTSRTYFGKDATIDG